MTFRRIAYIWVCRLPLFLFQTSLRSSLSNLQNVDMASAITQLTQLQTSLQATLQVAASSMQLNLFKFL